MNFAIRRFTDRRRTELETRNAGPPNRSSLNTNVSAGVGRLFQVCSAKNEIFAASVYRQPGNRGATLCVFRKCPDFDRVACRYSDSPLSLRSNGHLAFRQNCCCQRAKALALQLRASLLFRSGSLGFRRRKFLTAFWVAPTTYFVGAPALNSFRTGKKPHALNCAHTETLRELKASITFSFQAHSPQPAQQATSRKPAEHGATC